MGQPYEADRVYRRELSDRLRYLRGHFPCLGRFVNLQTERQHVRVRAQRSGDPLQFLIGLLPVSQTEPALSRIQMKPVAAVKRTEQWSLAQRPMRKPMSAPKTVLLRSLLSTRFIAILPTCLPIPQTLLVTLSKDSSRALTG